MNIKEIFIISIMIMYTAWYSYNAGYFVGYRKGEKNAKGN